MAPRLAAHRDRIVQNEPLFRRIEALYNSPDKARLTPEQQRVIWLRYTNLVLAGARLGPEEKKQVAAINQRLATLFTAFSQSVLSDEEHNFVVLESAADLAGLPAGFLVSAAAAAAERDMPGRPGRLSKLAHVDQDLSSGRGGKAPSVGRLVCSTQAIDNLALVQMEAGNADRIKMDLDLAPVSPDQRGDRDIVLRLDDVFHLGGHPSQGVMVGIFTPETEREDRHIINVAGFHEGLAHPGWDDIIVGQELGLEPDNGFFLVLAHVETHDRQ